MSSRLSIVNLRSFLESSANSQNQQVLNASGTYLGSLEFISEVITWIRTNKPAFVFLDECNIDDDGASLLAEILNENSYIQLLSVRGNWISARGAIYFAEIFRSNNFLQSFNIMSNPIGEGVMQLIKAFESSRTLRSIGGLMQGNGELIVRNGMNQSDPFLIAGEVRRNLDMKFLEITGTRNIDHIFRALEFNTTLIRFKCLDLNIAEPVLLDICKSISKNSTLKTFEMAMDSQNTPVSDHTNALQEIFHSMEMNRGLTTFAMEDFWMTQDACKSYSHLIMSNQTLQHLVFINNRMSLPEVSII
eukprot:gene7759-15876_t